MKGLQKGSRGADVRRWQEFLIGRGLLTGLADGEFGAKTQAATRAFQTKQKLLADGGVGNRTMGAAMSLGLGVVREEPIRGRRADQWPPAPELKPLSSTAARQRVFGKFAYEPTPTSTNREKITITDGWVRDNIVRVEVPQLAKLGLRRDGRVQIHRAVEKQFLGLWQAWEDKGLLDRVVTFHGTFVPRLVRGGTSLSNHSFGSAFDINLKANRLGHVPALVGEPGSVRELVPIANRFGFFWGGHFTRRDGMHFEVAALE